MLLYGKVVALLLAQLVEAYGQDCKLSFYIRPNSGSYAVRSPRYPNKYSGPSTSCYWYYYTDQGNRLTMDCYNVEMKSNAPWDCSDRLTVAGSLNDDENQFCSPFNVESASNRMMLIMRIEPRSEGSRFQCSIRAIKGTLCDCGWSPRMRVVGGKETGINEFPLMVGIIDVRKRSNSCGGSIISKDFVLTAAHCLAVLDVKLTGLLVGEHDIRIGEETNATRLHRAAEFISHPNYDPKLSWHDIGLIRSATTFQFNVRVGPVCLPFNRPNLPSVGEYVTAMGWGTISFGGPTSDVLLKTRLQVVSERRCQAVFSTSASSGKQVCTYTPGKDTCQMDSGGPLITSDQRTGRYFLAALVSFGPSDCGGADPSVNTRITPYLDWIKKRTGEEFCIK